MIERDEDYESRFLTSDQLAELDRYRAGFTVNDIYAPNSIYHELTLHGARLPLSSETLQNIELNRLRDFISFLFEDDEHCSHTTEREAWDEFEQWEYSQLLNSEQNVQVCDATGLNQGTASGIIE